MKGLLELGAHVLDELHLLGGGRGLDDRALRSVAAEVAGHLQARHRLVGGGAPRARHQGCREHPAAARAAGTVDVDLVPCSSAGCSQHALYAWDTCMAIGSFVRRVELSPSVGLTFEHGHFAVAMPLMA